MSDAIHIKIGEMKSEKTEADPKFQKSMPGVMKKMVEKVWAAEGILDKKPKDENKPNYGLIGSLTSLTKSTDGKKTTVACTLKMSLTEFPKGKTTHFSNGANSPTSADGKRLERDATACVEGAAEDLATKIVKHLRKKS
jgi:hypothetical protein